MLERLKAAMLPRFFPDGLMVHYIVTEYDPASPTVVVEVTNHRLELEPDTDLVEWARGPWPPPRYDVKIASVYPARSLVRFGGWF